MTIPYQVIVGENLSPLQKNICQQVINQTFEEINQKFNKFNPQSELSAINRLKAQERMNISHEMFQFLSFVGKLVTLTEGKFDPTVEKLQTVWKEHLERGEKPSEGEIGEVAQSVGWSHIHFDNTTLYKDHSLTSLDFGGVAKGHCVDLIIFNLKRLGFNNLLVEWGGEIFCIGNHPSGRPWMIEIPHPEETGPIAKIPLTNQGIATSGNYLQQWEIWVGGKWVHYTHILNPKTSTPLTIENGKITSSTVVANNCALADALATTLMLFDTPEESQKWAEALRDKDPSLSFWLAIQN